MNSLDSQIENGMKFKGSKVKLIRIKKLKILMRQMRYSLK